MPNIREKFLPVTFYHIYNHAVGSDNLFKEERNYPYFLRKYEKYLHPVCDTYAYCLMPNHFHFLLRFKSDEGSTDFSKSISKGLSDFLNSYAKSFNTTYNRSGALFRQSTPRKILSDNQSISTLIHYIHLNPVKHGFVKKPEEWKYSSYQCFINNEPTFVDRQFVLDWLGGANEFVKFHQTESPNPDPKGFQNL
jgi:putative transposase